MTMQLPDPTEPDQPLSEAKDAPAQPASGSDPVPGLDQLLPALIEINIRQARAGGQTDLAQALQSLQRQLQARDQTREPPKQTP